MPASSQGSVEMAGTRMARLFLIAEAPCPSRPEPAPPCFVLSCRGAELDGCRALPLLLTVRFTLL